MECDRSYICSHISDIHKKETMKYILFTLTLLVLLSSCFYSENNEKSKVAFKNALEKEKNKDFFGALIDYTTSIKLNPSYADAYRNRATVKAILKDHSGAFLDYNKCIELLPDNSGAYNDRGCLKDDLKDYNGAITDFSKALEITPFFPKVYSNMGLCRAKMGDFDVAILCYSKAIEQSWLQDSFRYSVPTLNNIREQKKRLVNCYYLRALLYLRQQKKDDACRDFNELQGPILKIHSLAYLDASQKMFIKEQVRKCN